MRALIQRVSGASVSISDTLRSKIDKGLLVLVGFEPEDTEEDVDWMCNKIIRLRLFTDEEKRMNLSVKEVDGKLLVVSQFTLHASTKKGNRPSFLKAASPEIAIPLYELFLDTASVMMPGKVGSGEFGADMQVSLVNDGPVTVWIDSKNRE